jgi:hypothetical protein
MFIGELYDMLERSQRDQRGGPCWLLKLRWWGLKEYKWKGSLFAWLFVGLVVPVQETFILPWLLWSAQYKIFFSSPYTAVYQFMFPHRPANWQAVVQGRLSLNVCLRSHSPVSYMLSTFDVKSKRSKRWTIGVKILTTLIDIVHHTTLLDTLYWPNQMCCTPDVHLSPSGDTFTDFSFSFWPSPWVQCSGINCYTCDSLSTHLYSMSEKSILYTQEIKE